jgi:rhodanese-related sulfurtransferase
MPGLVMTVQEVRALLEAGRPVRLVDCRERDEFEICRLARAELMPLSIFAYEAAEKLRDPSETIVLYCHHGMRSLRAAEFLSKRGFRDVHSMTGGIDAWAAQVDPALRRY